MTETKITHHSTIREISQFKDLTSDILLELMEKGYPQQKVRVLVMGAKGSGKTRTKSTLASTMQNRYGLNVGLSSNDSEHVTLKGREVVLWRNCPFVFVDTVGIDLQSENYPQEVIEAAMDGRLIGVEYDAEKKEWVGEFNPPNVEKEIHIVCLICGQKEILAEGQDSFQRKMQLILRLAKKRGMGQMMIVTKVDQMCPEGVPNDWYNNEKFQKDYENVLKDAAQKKFGLDHLDIHVIKNYTGSEPRKLDINTSNRVLDILKAVRNCLGHLEQRDRPTVDETPGVTVHSERMW